MKAMFNGTCSVCKNFKPRCAAVTPIYRLRGRERAWKVLCEDCRRPRHGLYRLDARHK